MGRRNKTLENAMRKFQVFQDLNPRYNARYLGTTAGFMVANLPGNLLPGFSRRQVRQIIEKNFQYYMQSAGKERLEKINAGLRAARTKPITETEFKAYFFKMASHILQRQK